LTHLSNRASVLNYWRGTLERRHNGVFAVARISEAGSSLELMTDAFGISPLYYRRFPSGLVLFSSSPRYLRVAGDRIDPIGARTLLHRKGLCGDRSLIEGVRRLPPGHLCRMQAGSVAEAPWFEYHSLPPGDEPLDGRALRRVEEVFQVAMDRCLALMPAAPVKLPLSSGDDSRRILATLVARGRPFEALTVRVLQKGFRDLDARYASAMAELFGFGHRVLEYASPDEYAADDRACRRLLASETIEHAWVGPLVRALGPAPGLVFDGLAGDVVGNTGFGVADLHVCPEHEKLEKVAALTIPDACTSVLKANAWAPLEEARRELVQSLRILPEGRNRADLAFLLTRSRRGTALVTQCLLPPGLVPVYPYLELHHVHETLRYDPLLKLEQTLQARCLQHFWPEYFAVPGSRRFSSDVLPGSGTALYRLQSARMAALYGECGTGELLQRLHRYLRPRAAATALAGRLSSRIAHRASWWLDVFLALMSFDVNAPPLWHADSLDDGQS
jgi:hypothetical protein